MKSYLLTLWNTAVVSATCCFESLLKVYRSVALFLAIGFVLLFVWAYWLRTPSTQSQDNGLS